MSAANPRISAFRYVGSPSRHLRVSLPTLFTPPLDHFSLFPSLLLCSFAVLLLYHFRLYPPPMNRLPLLLILPLAACQNPGGFPDTPLDLGRTQTIAQFPDQITGVAVSSTGRIFISSPRWHTDGPLRSVFELKPTGERSLYPDANWNSWTPTSPDTHSPDTKSRFVCVQSVHVDGKDRLWILDPASPKLAGTIPGAAKLIQIDLRTDTVARIIRFDESVAPADSYLNDIRVDTRTETAYITDSGRGGIIVINLADNTARRTLDKHPSTLPDPNFVAKIDNRELRFSSGPNANKPLLVASDGLALDPRGDYLYYQPLSARRLYRIPTSALRGTDGRPERTALAVQDLGPSIMTDGMDCDARGILYFTSIEENAIVARTPDGKYITIAEGPAISWPDSFAIARGKLFFTTSQIHKTAWFTPDNSMPTTPYQLLRTELPNLK
jgi:sugar lactone lactonase YvrE